LVVDKKLDSRERYMKTSPKLIEQLVALREEVCAIRRRQAKAEGSAHAECAEELEESS